MIIGVGISASSPVISGGGASFLTNSIGAWSVARGIDGYTGNLIEVREDGGDTVANIGVDVNGDLDEVALLAHCGANNGYVRTIYDQVNGKNGIQTTAVNQPRIVLSGVVDLRNGKPCMVFDATNDFLDFGYLNDGSRPSSFSFSTVFSDASPSALTSMFGSVISSGTSINSYMYVYNYVNKFNTGFGDGTNQSDFTSTSQPLTQDVQHILGLTYSGGDSETKSYLDGGGQITGSSSGTAIACTGTEYKFSVGRPGERSSLYWGGRMQELICWNIDNVSNREDNRDNQNDYYNTYTP
jgi:hypothetical protein